MAAVRVGPEFDWDRIAVLFISGPLPQDFRLVSAIQHSVIAGDLHWSMPYA